MAYYKKSQLAKLLGKKTAWVSMYVGRGKLVMSGDVIDDQQAPNTEFIQKWLEIKLEKRNPEDNGVSNTPKIEKPVAKSLKSPKIEHTSVEQSGETISALDKKAKLVEIERKESAVILNRLKAQKMRGESIPTNLVVNVFAMLGQEMQTAYKNGAQNLLTEIAHRAKLSPEITGELRNELTRIINESHSSAIRQTEKNIRSIISDAREVGDDHNEEENENS